MRNDLRRLFRHNIATPRASGFTLVELMITLGLVAVLVAIAAPSVGKMIRRAQSKTLARGVINQLRVARNQAMSRGEVVFVELTDHVTLGRGSVSMFRSTNNASSCRSVQLADRVLPAIQRFDALTVPEPYRVGGFYPTNANIVCFQPDGRVMRVGGTPLDAGGCDGEALVIYTEGQVVNAIDNQGCGTRTIDDAGLNQYWRISVWDTGQITMSNK